MAGAGNLLMVVAVTALLQYSAGHEQHSAPRMRRTVSSSEQFSQTNWNSDGQSELKRALKMKTNTERAKNVILFVGDGMGITTTSAARVYKAQKTNTKLEEGGALSWEDFPHVALSQTYTVDYQVPDSSATATAFLSGEKVNFYTVGVNQNVPMGNCTALPGNQLKSILTQSMEEGKWTGVVTNTRITHATPSSAYAHSPNRDWEYEVPQDVVDREMCTDLARQLIEDSTNQNIRVLLGGGRIRFLPTGERDLEPETFPNFTGLRGDGKNLINEWSNIKERQGFSQDEYKFVKNKAEFDSIDAKNVDYVLGLFNPGHMDYETERISRSPPREPSLTEMVDKAISILSRGPQGYFLLVEGGRIDHAHHANGAFRALNETLAMSEAVQRAKELTSEEDTLLVVTADHSHVFTFGGYPAMDSDVFGLAADYLPEWGTDDGKPYLSLSYTNGPGFLDHRTLNGDPLQEVPRKDLTGVDTGTSTFRQDAGVPMLDETHGGEDVAIYARGPMSHLFHGSHQQSYIAHVMTYASCVGQNKEHCMVNSAGSLPASVFLHCLVLFLVFIVRF